MQTEVRRKKFKTSFAVVEEHSEYPIKKKVTQGTWQTREVIPALEKRSLT